MCRWQTRAAAADTTQVRMHVVDSTLVAVVLRDHLRMACGHRGKAMELGSRMQTSADLVGVGDGDCVTLVLRMPACAPMLAASVRKMGPRV